MSLPAADDLFRPTVVPDDDGGPAQTAARTKPEAVRSGEGADDDEGGAPRKTGPRGSSGRVRHDEKMTVYVTSDELLDLEHARLTLRRRHGVAVDRGRLVREAVAIALADLEANGEDSLIVQRLNQP